MSLTPQHAFLLAFGCLMGGIFLQYAHPGDAMGIMLLTTAAGAMGTGAVMSKKQTTRLETENETIKVEKKQLADDLEATTTTLKKMTGN